MKLDKVERIIIIILYVINFVISCSLKYIYMFKCYYNAFQHELFVK